MRIVRIITIAVTAAAVLTIGTQFRGTHARLLPVVQAQNGCWNGSLHGSYGFQINGTIIGLGPIGGVARVTYDGAGNFTQTDNVSVNGFPIVPNRPGSGIYSVNADCTGTQTLNQAGGQVVHTAFVIVGGGKQVLDVVTDPHVVITGNGTRIGSED